MDYIESLNNKNQNKKSEKTQLHKDMDETMSGHLHVIVK